MSSIGIYGMGGVGKTTLVKHINNMILGKIKEKSICWLTFAQVFSVTKLQDEIARSIGLDPSSGENKDKRAAKLHEAIRNNCILILDDVWKNICLKKLGDPLHLEGCRLILTMRSFEVCCQMGCEEKVVVEKLHEDEAWNLFKRELGQNVAPGREIENIAKDMTKVCGGLPLGIIVLAGSMRDETCIGVWRNELRKLRDPNTVQDDDEYEVFKVPKYSFDRLNLNCPLCFLECFFYPEDYEKKIGESSKRFIREDLVDIRKNRQSQLDEAHSIINKLVKFCLLERGYRSVKMHDLVRLMALKVSNGKNLVISGLKLKESPNEGEWIKDIEKVSLMHNHITKIPDGVSPYCPKLITLVLSRNYGLNFISESFFSQLHNLCSLDLSKTSIEKLPNSLSNLENLKALNLQFCRKLVDIPDLGKLKKLRELDLSETAIQKVPQGMEGLVGLRCLSLSNRALVILPQGLFRNFKLLQYLRLPIHITTSIEEISKLNYLELFCGQVKDFSEFNKCIGCRQSQLSAFRIMVGERANYEAPMAAFGNDKKELVLEQCDLKEQEEDFLYCNII